MSRADDVLAECAANPDDDAPRLVWADLVGGERGELVVVQCDLARGGLTDDEARTRRARERELLDAHGVEWAGDLARRAYRWSFRRGFVEAASLRGDTSPARWPLLASVTISTSLQLERLAATPQIRALGIRNHLRLEAPARFTHLRGFSIENATGTDFEHVQHIVANNPIEHLRLRRQAIPVHLLADLLAAAPRVTALEITAANTPSAVDVLFERPLRALRLGLVRYRDLARLPGSVAASTLERISFDLLGEAPLLDDVLAACPRLRIVERRGELGGHDELLHESPDAMLALGPPCFVRSEPACIVRLDNRAIFEIPPHASDEMIDIGRGRDTTVCLTSGTVARRHARLTWIDGAHELVDLNSTNGVIIDNERVQRAVLHDGDVLVLGAITIQYFVGAGCRERAEAIR